MMKLRSLVLTPLAAVSLITVGVDCGSYAARSGGTSGSGALSGGAPGENPGGAGAANSGAGAPGSSGANTSGGASGVATAGSSGMATGSGPSIGGAPSNGGASGSTGGASAAGAASAGAPATAGASAGGAGGDGIALPCDVLNTGGAKCVAAHSTVRVIVPGYTGPLYQLCKGTAAAGPASCKGTTQDIAAKAGYADAAAHDAFCTGGTCTITKIYDQSGQKNDLEPAPKGGAKGTPDNPADASALKVTINGHSAYGILIKAGIGYRTGCSGCTIKTGNGMVKGDDPESMYWVTSQNDLIDGCCFDYGNAETTSNDDGNGTMETLYFGGGVVWGTGAGGKPGPWMMADLENGLYAGWENKQDKNISTNKKLPYDFVTGVLLGDTKDKNSAKGRFAIFGGDATTGALQTMYDGIRPEKPGYVPMSKQGSIILGIGGDNSNSAGGRFYEGAVTAGPVASKATVDALQAAIVAAKYGK
ncbi:MAG TPA: arabinofuranosidase catalytic domain-containing protein [Polyangiaceae bacterium]|nr:arabinofuranosidase catalytic domain-containing protein [Polyangiaceae bacterium]